MKRPSTPDVIATLINTIAPLGMDSTSIQPQTKTLASIDTPNPTGDSIVGLGQYDGGADKKPCLVKGADLKFIFTPFDKYPLMIEPTDMSDIRQFIANDSTIQWKQRLKSLINDMLGLGEQDGYAIELADGTTDTVLSIHITPETGNLNYSGSATIKIRAKPDAA